MNFQTYNTFETLKDKIVTGNIVETKFLVDNIEDSGFNAEEIKSSTKKNMDEDLKNVWSMLNNLHKQQIHHELEWVEDNRASDPVQPSKKRNIQQDWFADRRDEHKDAYCKPVSQTEKVNFTEDSGVFRMSIDRSSSFSRSCYLKNGSIEEPKYWNHGEFSTNAISEPWAVENKEVSFDHYHNEIENLSLCAPPPEKKAFRLKNVLSRK